MKLELIIACTAHVSPMLSWGCTYIWENSLSSLVIVTQSADFLLVSVLLSNTNSWGITFANLFMHEQAGWPYGWVWCMRMSRLQWRAYYHDVASDWLCSVAQVNITKLWNIGIAETLRDGAGATTKHCKAYSQDNRKCWCKFFLSHYIF